METKDYLFRKDENLARKRRSELEVASLLGLSK